MVRETVSFFSLGITMIALECPLFPCLLDVTLLSATPPPLASPAPATEGVLIAYAVLFLIWTVATLFVFRFERIRVLPTP